MKSWQITSMFITKAQMWNRNVITWHIIAKILSKAHISWLEWTTQEFELVMTASSTSGRALRTHRHPKTTPSRVLATIRTFSEAPSSKLSIWWFRETTSWPKSPRCFSARMTWSRPSRQGDKSPKSSRTSRLEGLQMVAQALTFQPRKEITW